MCNTVCNNYTGRDVCACVYLSFIGSSERQRWHNPDRLLFKLFQLGLSLFSFCFVFVLLT